MTDLSGKKSPCKMEKEENGQQRIPFGRVTEARARAHASM